VNWISTGHLISFDSIQGRVPRSRPILRIHVTPDVTLGHRTPTDVEGDVGLPPLHDVTLNVTLNAPGESVPYHFADSPQEATR